MSYKMVLVFSLILLLFYYIALLRWYVTPAVYTNLVYVYKVNW